MKTKQLPKGWREVELGDICEVLTGFAFKSNLFNEEEKGKPIIRIRDLAKGKSKTYYSGKFEEKYLVKRGDFLIGMDGEFKVFEWKSENALLNQRVCKLILNKDLVIPKYIYYMISKKLKEIEDKTPFVTVKHISNKQILSIKFILPPTSIQNSIVQILEKAETLKQKREDADKLTKEYLQSVFYEMFGDPVRNEKKWKYIETQELFDMKLGKMLSARNYTGKNLRPYLRNINVQWGHLDLSDVNEMDFDEDEYIKYQLKKGDILVCEGGEVGRTAIYNGEINNCCYQNALHRLRIKDKKINPTYFIYFMEIAVKLGLIKKDTIQVTIAHFTQDKFKRFEIPLPPLPLQHKFASIVEEVEKLKEKQKQSKEELKVMFDSLMKQAFNGELVK